MPDPIERRLFALSPPRTPPRWGGPARGIAVATALVVVLTLLMFPLRAHVSVATAALVLVVPVVVGVVVGGVRAGIVATALGFLAYDFVFIPPYYTLYVGAAQNWAALVVYTAVMVVVAQVVGRMESARREARARASEMRRLLDLSETLVRDDTMPEVLQSVVSSVTTAFDLTGAALLLPDGGGLRLVSSAGLPLDEENLQKVVAGSGAPVHMARSPSEPDGIQVLALVTGGRAVGLLVLRGLPKDSRNGELLRGFTNQLALVIERSELREEAVRARLLEETERLGRALIGAVSHDLRTPLATIKVAASTLLDAEAPVSGPDRDELVGLIDMQADRLDRLVANLLDVTRIRSGHLELRPEVVPVSELVDQAVSFLGPAAYSAAVKVDLPAGLPDVEVDPVLIRQVLVNLIDNALRYAPEGSAVTISGAPAGPRSVEVRVADEGPGITAEEGMDVFQMMSRRESGGRAGLGLVIVKAFLEAHGQRVWVDRTSGGSGAVFAFTLPASPVGADRRTGG
jgi:two-component system sensor histidine kinase KdpD